MKKKNTLLERAKRRQIYAIFSGTKDYDIVHEFWACHVPCLEKLYIKLKGGK